MAERSTNHSHCLLSVRQQEYTIIPHWPPICEHLLLDPLWHSYKLRTLLQNYTWPLCLFACIIHFIVLTLRGYETDWTDHFVLVIPDWTQTETITCISKGDFQEKVILVWDWGITEIASLRADMGQKSAVFDVCRNRKQCELSYSEITIVPWVCSHEPNQLFCVLVDSIEFLVCFFQGFALCMYVFEPLSLRVPVHVHQELAVSLMESSRWSRADRAGRGKVQPRADLHFKPQLPTAAAARQPPH